MNFILSNPAGLWGLAAIPVILLIHFLQEQSRRVKVSTLFLLDRVKPESVGGAKLERLRQSVPLWLQLLAALLITWILVAPRWVTENSRQVVAVVLDSSASMNAFKEDTKEALQSKLRQWMRGAARTEWHLLPSDPRKPALYTGEDLKALLAAYDTWQPVLGAHRPDDVFNTARNLVKQNGVIIYVTDHKVDVPSDIALLSIGEPIENVGFAGADCQLVDAANENSGLKWRVLLKNYGKESVVRQWWVEQNVQGDAAPVASPSQSVTLAPGQTIALNGELPPDVQRATLRLNEDKFTWDDQMPLQKPKRRTVSVEVAAGGKSGELLRKMVESLDGVSFGGPQANAGPSDLVLGEVGESVNTHAIQISTGAQEDTRLDGNWTVAEDHALTRDLNWMGLLTARPSELSITPEDEPLLWKSDAPLAFIRQGQNDKGQRTRRLILNWDLAASNAGRHPAVLVMLHRFIQLVRDELEGVRADNFEVGQELKLVRSVSDKTAAASSEAQLVLKDAEGTVPFRGRAPEHAGFFDITENGRLLIAGAARFADTRESDFQKAERVDTVDERRWEAALKQTEADPLLPLWMLLILGCFIGAWGWKERTVVRPIRKA